jgi:predicted MPP superfamily phosphohydrolase
MAIDILNKRDVDLILSGNSLGGQINIPNVGGLFKIDGSRKYIDNYYRINNTDLYVSSGIGTRKYPYRLFNHPSINFYRIK